MSKHKAPPEDLQTVEKGREIFARLHPLLEREEIPHTHHIAINVGTEEFVTGENRDVAMAKYEKRFGPDTPVYLRQIGRRERVPI